jgi:hypothetical protein
VPVVSNLAPKWDWLKNAVVFTLRTSTSIHSYTRAPPKVRRTLAASDAIPLNLQGLRLLNLSYEPTPKNWPLHKEFGAKMIRGEFDTLPEGVDGAIQFLDDGRIYEVALPPSTANRQRSVTPTADIATTRRS